MPIGGAIQLRQLAVSYYRYNTRFIDISAIVYEH